MLVAVDTGGTKTLIWVFDERGESISKLLLPTPKDSADYLVALAKEIRDIKAQYTIDIVSIALPGVVKDNVLLWAGNLPWKNIDIPAVLASELPGIPIIVENDANLGGLGETRLLEPAPNVSLYTTISTGIGTGVIIDGRISHLHSESGHLLLEFDGVVREWEDFASGAAIYKTYGKYARDIDDARTWYHIAQRISRGFLVLIPVLQPDIIIIGGSIGTHFEQYHDDLVGILKERLPAHIPCPPFLNAAHPEEAVIYGCYYHALDTLAGTQTNN